MKKLRLLITEDCNRNCAGCCNKDWDLAALPVETDYSGYDEIILTGGEPMLSPMLVWQVIREIREQNSDARIIMYTAKTDTIGLLFLLDKLDGLTVTIHEKADWKPFLKFNRAMCLTGLFSMSLRLNVFREAGYHEFANNEFWIVKKDIEWIENCPLPENEVFKRI